MRTSDAHADLLGAAARHIVTVAHMAGETDRAIAIRCVMHHLACSLEGATLPWSKAAIALAFEHRADPVATIMGSDRRTTPGAAVFANAVLGQSTLAEDIHPDNLVHVGSIVIPVAFAIGEQRHASGVRVLNAIIAGYNVVSRIATALKTPDFVSRGFRPSGVFAPFGAVAAAACLLDLTEEQTIGSLALAANTCAGLREWAHGGTTDVYFQNGFGARNGYDCALLAAQGVTGPSGALSGPAGLGVAYSGNAVDWDSAVEALRHQSAMQEIQFKRFPACSGVQTALQLAVAMQEEHKLVVDEIKRITVRTHHHGKYNPGCDNPGPWANIGQAQMSNQLGVAIALSGRPIRMDEYASYDDIALSRLAARVEVHEERCFTAVYPERSPVAIDIELSSGNVVHGELADGDPLRPEEVFANFAGAVSARYTSPISKHIVDLTARLDQLSVITELTDELRKV